VIVRNVVSHWVVLGALTVITVPVALGQSPADSALGLFFKTRYADALPLFEKAVKAEPANAELRAQLADTYRRMGRTGDAVRAAREALACPKRNA